MKHLHIINQPEKGIILKQYVHDINRYRFNWHREMEITLVLSGEIEFCVQGTVYTLREDDLILVDSNCGHASLLKKPDSYAMVVRFDPVIFRTVFDDYANLHFACLCDDSNRYSAAMCKIRRYAAQMLLAFCREGLASEMMAEGSFLLLASTLLEEFPPVVRVNHGRGGEMSHRKTIQAILEYTEQNYQRRITLEEIAKISRYNRTYLSSFFKANVGINFYEHLMRIRLRHAVFELNTTDKSLTQIALDSGFPDLKAFSCYFKRYFRKSPSQYRAEEKYDRAELAFENQRNYLPIKGTWNIEAKLHEYLNAQPIEQNAEEKLLQKEDPAPSREEELRAGMERLRDEIAALLY